MVAELPRASRGHLMSPRQEPANRFVDMVVSRPVGHQPRAVAEVARPATQEIVQPGAYVVPGRDIGRDHDLRHTHLEALHALRRRAGPQIPVTILPEVVRPEAVAQEVEVFLPRITHGSLRFVDGEPKPGHDLPRPRQRLCRVSAAEDDEVVGIVHDMRFVGVTTALVTPVPEKAVHVSVSQQRAGHSSHNGAKLPFDLTITIPRDRLRPLYRDGFAGAPLMPWRRCNCHGAGPEE